MATAKKAEIKDAKVKCLVWGEPGAGKSRFGLSAPAPLVIDYEESTALYANEFDFLVARIDKTIEKQNRPVNLTTTILEEIEKGEYPDTKTLVIDPVTDLLDDIEDICVKGYEKIIGKSVTTLNQLEKSKWYAYRRKNSRRMLDRIKALPLNLILVARTKNIWDRVDGKTQPVGKTYDALEIVESLMDIVIHLEKTEKTITAKIKKSRLGDIAEELVITKGYDSIVEALNKKDTSTKTATPVNKEDK